MPDSKRRMVDFRQAVVSRYSSSSVLHRPMDEKAVAAYVRTYRQLVKPHLPDGRKCAWLDIACGQGNLLRVAKDLGFQEVEGADASPEMVDLATRTGAHVTKADALTYLEQESAGRWDVVSAFDFMEHLTREDGLRLLIAARESMREGGVCLLKLPNGENPWAGAMMAGDLTHLTLYTPESLAQLGRLAGFTRISVVELPPVVHGLASLGRAVLWRGLRKIYEAMALIEAGSAGYGVWTRVMIARMER